MPKVSVIIPVYNVSNFLNRCIDSVLKQSFSDFDLYIIDDGSFDSSAIECDKYASISSKVFVIHKYNKGLSSARNIGLSIAPGEYLYLCDGDDYVAPNLLERCVNNVTGKDYLAFNYKLVNEDGQSISEGTKYKSSTYDWRSFTQKKNYLKYDFFYRSFGWSTVDKLYKKSIIHNYDLRFEDNNRIFAEDLFFSFCYVVYCNSAICIPDVLYYYTQRSNSIMHVQNHNYNFDRYNELCKTLERYINEKAEFAFLKDDYPRYYFEIMSHSVREVKAKNPGLSIWKIRKGLLREIDDYSFFINQIYKLKNGKLFADLKNDHGDVSAWMYLSEFQYYCDGKYIRYFIREMLILLLRILRKCKRMLL